MMEGIKRYQGCCTGFVWVTLATRTISVVLSTATDGAARLSCWKVEPGIPISRRLFLFKKIGRCDYLWRCQYLYKSLGNESSNFTVSGVFFPVTQTANMVRQCDHYNNLWIYFSVYRANTSENNLIDPQSFCLIDNDKTVHQNQKDEKEM
jgi:hypothetical protein